MNDRVFGVIGNCLGIVSLLILFASCKDADPSPTPTSPGFTITIDPAIEYQRMIGFGGGLTWYSNWLVNSPHKNEIADLIFNDLGIDIIRFKTWYYPDNYPNVTSTEVMSDDNSKVQWDATNELYTMAKNRSSAIKVLLSSWGPPASLKSNNNTREGTLKKDDENKFMYGTFAEYWERTLDHLPFDPDYISIQNEPTYSNPGWTTCVWSSTETTSLPSYMVAFDSVYNRIKDRPGAPIMIGPESQDIPTYGPFAEQLSNRDHCGVLAYHPYNINANTSEEQAVISLQNIATFKSKPNLMSEYSDNLQGWYNTSIFIQNTLLHANSSGYIYWKLIWSTPANPSADAAMVSIKDNAGSQYTVTPFYYLMKHFAKHIDEGYYRVKAESSNVNLSVSAFKNPEGNKLTIIIINKGPGQVKTDFTVTGKTISTISADQTITDSYYKSVENLSADSQLIVPKESITTVVIGI